MRTEIKVRKEVTLTFTEKEAKWLKDALQNPLIEDETPEDERIRGDIFDSLKEAGI